MKMNRNVFFITALMLGTIISQMAPVSLFAAYRFGDFKASQPIHIYATSTSTPLGYSPTQIKQAYNLPQSGGKGTIAIIDAYDNSAVETDLAAFDKQYGLKDCTTKDKCLVVHNMAAKETKDSGWATEAALDVEWAHAMAPSATILLVDATTPSGDNLLDAIDYAKAQKGVVAVSMSWGGAEFSDETTLDNHFASSSATFFASSGDNGNGASWPAASPNVVAVGGTSLTLSISKSGSTTVTEKAWSGSGGGASAYEKEPAYQAAYSIAKAGGMRAIPDVSFNADPATGYAIYHSGKWLEVGGTSAVAPQWAAIKALGLSASNNLFYADKASSSTAKYFRDITSGINGSCTYYCTARKHYDYVTGLGSPLTTKF
jgi:subtilase family serine protease